MTWTSCFFPFNLIFNGFHISNRGKTLYQLYGDTHNTSIAKNNDKNTAYCIDFALRMEQKTLKLQILFLLYK